MNLVLDIWLLTDLPNEINCNDEAVSWIRAYSNELKRKNEQVKQQLFAGYIILVIHPFAS